MFWLNVTNITLAIWVLAFAVGTLIAALMDIAERHRRKRVRGEVRYRQRWRLS